MKKSIYKYLYILIIITQIILIIKYNKDYYIKKTNKIEKKSVEYILNKKTNYNEKNDNNEIKLISLKKEKLIKYEIIIEIPKIKLKRGILNKNNKDNNIEKNIMILKESVYPNQIGNIFLAAHSGTGKKSFFDKLDKMILEDKVILYYKGKKYDYRVSKIYEKRKDESILIQSSTLNNLYLITCSQKNKSNYLIIELKKTEN